jgi:eukaryotic-like serine/threonine-protein kinase
MQEPPRRRALWPWLVIPLVLVVAGAIGALLAVRANSREPSVQEAPLLTVAPAPRRMQPARASSSAESAEGSVTVPAVSGEKVSDARKAIREAGLVVDVTRVSSSSPKNTVVSQAPGQGANATLGDHVLLTVSVGPEKGRGHHGKGRGNGAGGGGEEGD